MNMLNSMMKATNKALGFLIKFTNKALVFFIKLAKGTMVTAFLLTFLFLGALLVCDIFLLDSYCMNLMSKQLMELELGQTFFELGYFINQNLLLSSAIFVTASVLLIALVSWIRKRMLKYNLFLLHALYLPISLAGFCILFSMALFFSFQALLGQSFIKNYPVAETAAFETQYSQIRSELLDNKATARLALRQIMFTLEKEPDYLTEMTIDDRIAFCRGVNELIDVLDGPENAQEHYFRNRLNYAPETLERMFDEIRNPSGIRWQLLSSEQSALHMWGEDGEYNVKFVSADGIFEAVYSKDGALLTDENDPVNMGTYNYADPLTNKEKHTMYDVTPYLDYGNVSLADIEAIDDQPYPLEKYNANRDAQAHYRRIQEMLTETK